MKTQIEQINDVYNRLNSEFTNTQLINNKSFRTEFKKRLEDELPYTNIKCDEENNTPEIIDNCSLIARCSWIDKNETKYVDLIFGKNETIMINISIN